MTHVADKRGKLAESPGSDGERPGPGAPFDSPLPRAGSGRQARGSLAHPVAPSEEWCRWLPPLHSWCPDPSVPNQKLCVSAAVCPDRTGIALSAVDFNGGCYHVALTPTELERIKPAALSVQSFYASMAKQFAEQTFKVYRSGAKVMLILKDDVCFSLRHSDDPAGVTWAMIGRVLGSVMLRTGDAPGGGGPLAGATTEVQDLQARAALLTQQRADLRAALAQAEEEEQRHAASYAGAQAELMAATQRYHRRCEERGLDPKDFDGPREPPADGRQSYGRQPLETDAREFDAPLMELIKAAAPPLAHPDAAASTDSLCVLAAASAAPAAAEGPVRCLSPTEYADRLAALPEGKTRAVMECLRRLEEWDFDVWTVQDLTHQGSMFYTAYALFLRWDLFRKLNIDEQVAINFFSQVEAGYHPNPYHNAMHGADVMHILHYLLGPGKCAAALQLQDHDVLAMLVAGMIHDYDHPGLNNNFHLKIQSYLATLYNDRSVLENHHLAEVFDLMKTPRFNILASLAPGQYADVRETMIEVVLFTDMQLHAKILGNWKRRLTQNHKLSAKKDDQRLALAMCIKMADISNCCRPLPMYLKWSSVLVEEFFLQGDNERARGDPVSPFMDRQQPYMGKSQVAFMNYVVIPMLEAVAEFLPEMGFTVEIAMSNVAHWKTQKAAL